MPTDNRRGVTRGEFAPPSPGRGVTRGEPAPPSPGMRQYAPYPEELEELVRGLRYRPGWFFYLTDLERDPASTHGAAAGGLTLTILINCIDSYHPSPACEACGTVPSNFRVRHLFSVPAATYHRGSWRRWLFDCILKVEQHEAQEFFISGGERSYAPTHGPGDDPYVIHEYASDTQRRTTFQGLVAEPSGGGPEGEPVPLPTR